jgi:hypothetical protein
LTLAFFVFISPAFQQSIETMLVRQ